MRPIAASCPATPSASHASPSCRQRCRSNTDPPAPGVSGGRSGDVGRAGEARVLRAVDEAGEVAVVVVGPARGLRGDRRDRRERRDGLTRFVEETSYAAPASHSSASCWVDGMVKPSGPVTGRL